jgi:hypothetical protein
MRPVRRAAFAFEVFRLTAGGRDGPDHLKLLLPNGIILRAVSILMPPYSAAISLFRARATYFLDESV